MTDEVMTPENTSAAADSGVAELNESPDVLAPAEEAGNVDDSPLESSAETEAELKEDVEKAIEEGATEKEVKDMIREFELKVNGKKKKIKLDLSDESDLVRRLQLAEAGQDAMREKAELEKMFNQEVSRLRDNPWEVLKEIGHDPDKLAEQLIQERIEQMKKSPEQVEREKIEKELADARAKLKAQEDKVKEEQALRLQENAAVQLDQDITDVLKNDPELPKTRKTVRRIADAMLWAMENGFEDVTVSEVIPSVKAEIRSEMDEFLSEMPDELFEKWIGNKNIDRLRNRRLASMKKAPTVDVKPQAQLKKETEQEKRDKVQAKDFFRSLNRVP